MENNLGVLNAIFVQNVRSILKTKNGRQIVKEYVSTIKNNKQLLKEYLIYDTIQNINNQENSNLIISEAVSKLTESDKKKLIVEHKKLQEFFEKNNIKQKGDIKNIELLESINDLIFVKNSIKTINEKIDKVNKISNILESIRPKVNEKLIGIKESDIKLEEMINNFNEKYEDKFDEEDKKIFKTIVEAKEDEQMIQLFEDHRKECLKLTNEFLKEHIDSDTREKLLNVKEKLLEQKFNKKTFVQEIISLIELKNTLSE